MSYQNAAESIDGVIPLLDEIVTQEDRSQPDYDAVNNAEQTLRNAIPSISGQEHIPKGTVSMESGEKPCQTNRHTPTDLSKNTTVTNEKRDNPFLPYEHIDRLARERIEFQKQFEGLMKSGLRRALPTGLITGHADVERIVHLSTQRVLADYLPQIEQRIREEVIRQLNTLATCSKAD